MLRIPVEGIGVGGGRKADGKILVSTFGVLIQGKGNFKISQVDRFLTGDGTAARLLIRLEIAGDGNASLFRRGDGTVRCIFILDRVPLGQSGRGGKGGQNAYLCQNQQRRCSRPTVFSSQ